MQLFKISTDGSTQTEETTWDKHGLYRLSVISLVLASFFVSTARHGTEMADTRDAGVTSACDEVPPPPRHISIDFDSRRREQEDCGGVHRLRHSASQPARRISSYSPIM